MSIASQTEQPGVFRQVVSVNAHTLYADVAVASGGQASAPSPHDYFDTLAVYAKGHGMKLERVEVEITRDDTRERQGTYVLNVKLALFGDLSAEDRARLHDIAGRCPIHRLMTDRTVEINTAPL
jgi:putative redox protein